jgi:hypothetical protein
MRCQLHQQHAAEADLIMFLLEQDPYNWLKTEMVRCSSVAYPGIFFVWGGVSTNSVEEEGRKNRDLRAVAPLSAVLLNLQMS